MVRIVTELAGPPGKTDENSGFYILLTGTFYSDNWIKAHLKPLAKSKYCKKIIMVASNNVPPMDKVEAIYAPEWLSRTIGRIPARIILFIMVALRKRPYIVGGFHISPNALVAALTARLISAKAMYICGGGPRELEGGGYLSGNSTFGKLKKPDLIIERYLLETLSFFDIIITKGSRAYDLFKLYNKEACHIIPGGFEKEKFYPALQQPDNDLIFIGVLKDVKRLDIFLQAIAITRKAIPDISAIVVGDGPLRCSHEQLAKKLMIEENIKFVGHQDNVEEWLRRSKILALTSESEGLAQVMVQAMLCALPVVVSNVGDLSDLVENGVNGYLVKNRTPDEFAECFIRLLKDEEKLMQFGQASCHTAKICEMGNVGYMWDEIFKGFENGYWGKNT